VPISTSSGSTACIKQAASFVTRAKSNSKFRCVYSNQVDRSTGLMCDQLVELVVFYSTSLSRTAQTDTLHRPRRQALGVSYQQHHASSVDHLLALQEPLAGGTLLRMDQAAPAYQALLRHFRECRQDISVDRRSHVRAGSHYQKTFETRSVFVFNVTNPERDSVRKNSNASTAYRCGAGPK
jgi:hypothetical protein